MPHVYFQPQLRDLTGGQAEVQVDASTLRQLVVELEKRFPGLAGRIVRDDRIAPGLAVSIDGVVTSRGLLSVIGQESEVHFLPAIGGG